MAYHEDLIQHAIFLSGLNAPNEPNQVDLRRSVSSAYYCVFHLLTTEAAENWKNSGQRYRFARLFNHRPMKACAARVASRPLPDDPAGAVIAADLKLVANLFIKLQEARNTADYDSSKVWSRTEVWNLLTLAENAVTAWSRIRQQESAQDFLLDLMGTRQ